MDLSNLLNNNQPKVNDPSTEPETPPTNPAPTPQPETPVTPPTPVVFPSTPEPSVPNPTPVEAPVTPPPAMPAPLTPPAFPPTPEPSVPNPTPVETPVTPPPAMPVTAPTPPTPPVSDTSVTTGGTGDVFEGKGSGKYKVVVIKDKCIGAASCIAVSPKTFELNDQQIAKVLPTVTSESDENLLLAAQSCPTLAIEVYDTTTGEKVWPK